MGHVKITKLQIALGKVAVMNKVKKDVIGVKFTLNGKVCGVLVADIC